MLFCIFILFNIYQILYLITYFGKSFQCKSCRYRIFFKIILRALLLRANIFMQAVYFHQQLNAVL